MPSPPNIRYLRWPPGCLCWLFVDDTLGPSEEAQGRVGSKAGATVMTPVTPHVGAVALNTRDGAWF